jgi:predicted secreted acid phosphatase
MPHDAYQAIIDRISEAKSAGKDPLVVLDLDGTLYDNAHRILRILQEFSHLHGHGHQDLHELVRRLVPADIAYTVTQTLHAQGYKNDAVTEEAERFWRKRFFSSEYVVYDLPIPGAVELVGDLYKRGAVPAYLTGRDAPNMLLGTVRCLQRDGFPIGTVDTRLIMKQDFETKDTVYKGAVKDHLRASGELVAVFDNEPAICNLFKEAFPEAVVVWLDTRCTPDAVATREDVIRTPDFSSLLR